MIGARVFQSHSAKSESKELIDFKDQEELKEEEGESECQE